MKSTFMILTNTINQYGGFHDWGYKHLLFNGGEVNVTVPGGLGNHKLIVVKANIADAEGIMTLALIKDALDRVAPQSDIDLQLGYVPYARQDRVCNPGEALSIKVFCNMINAMNFDCVTILDPHSEVTPALLNRCRIVEQQNVLMRSNLSEGLRKGKYTLVAPDAGATKKVEKVSQYFGGLEVIQGMKKRDVKTGQLTGFTFTGDVAGKDLLLVDDICDGGGTFIGLGMRLMDADACSLRLYVSHGIFSKGIEPLLDTCFDEVYTTDSFNHGIINQRLHTIDWI